MTDASYNIGAENAVALEVDRSIPFIDTHHHLWELGRFHYDWLSEPGWAGHNALLGDYKAIRVDWPIERLLKEFYGSNVKKSVHVEAAYAGPDPVEETAWLQSLADTCGFPHALVVFCDIEKPDGAEQLRRHMEFANVRGVRIREHPSDPTNPAFLASYAELGRNGLSYELNASPGKLLSGRDVAMSFPSTQVILGHAGFPIERSAEYFERWRTEMSALARAENVACKISGFAMVDHDWTIESIRPWVLHCIESFGVERSMFGTNWPVDIIYSSYLRQVDAYRTILAREGFSRAEQEQLLFRNAERLYRI